MQFTIPMAQPAWARGTGGTGPGPGGTAAGGGPSASGPRGAGPVAEKMKDSSKKYYSQILNLLDMSGVRD